MPRDIYLPLDEAFPTEWRHSRLPDDPGPAPNHFDIAPPDRGSSPLACIVAIVLCGSIIAAGFMVANGLGWLG